MKHSQQARESVRAAYNVIQLYKPVTPSLSPGPSRVPTALVMQFYYKSASASMKVMVSLLPKMGLISVVWRPAGIKDTV